jgi:methionyl aminopeptidase
MSRTLTTSTLRSSADRRVASRGRRQEHAIALRSPDEIARMRLAGAVVAEALAAARAACVAGTTTAKVDAAAMGVIAARNAEPLFLGYPSADGSGPFPACTCISVNDEIVHGIPGSRVLTDGDLVSIDCGVRLDGWCSDSAITVAIGAERGAVAPEHLALIGVAQAMLDKAIELAQPGVLWSDIADAMQDLALDAGHGLVVEYVGHGIGRSLHEAPQVPNCLTRALIEREDFTLRPGMVLAIEPMITLAGPFGPVSVDRDRSARALDADGYPLGIAHRRQADGWTVVTADGSPAVHVEHTVAITRSGAEVLSLPTSLSSRLDRVPLPA